MKRENTVQQLNRIQRNLSSLAKDLGVTDNNRSSSKSQYEEEKSPQILRYGDKLQTDTESYEKPQKRVAEFFRRKQMRRKKLSNH